jgi:hypothetical protein
MANFSFLTDNINVATNIVSSNATITDKIYANGYFYANGVSIITNTFSNITVTGAISTASGNVITFPSTSGFLITSNNISALTIGTGLAGTSYNVTTPTTISIDSSVVTLSGSQNLTNKTVTSLSNSSTVLDSSGNSWQFGFRNMPQSPTPSGNLALGDSGKHVYLLTGAGVTVPPNSSVPFEIGSVITVISSATSVTITQGSGVTLKLANSASTGNRTLAVNGIATLLKVATDTWYIFGLGLT